jgi:hypothetical protein
MPVGRDSETLGTHGHKVCVRRGVVSQNQQIHVMNCTWVAVGSQGQYANQTIGERRSGLYLDGGAQHVQIAKLVTF